MKKTKVPFIVMLSLIFGMFVSGVGTVSAAEPGFSVQAVLPEAQIKRDISYFDLKMSRNQKETLQIKLTNNSTKPIQVEVSANTATTNLNGVIDYSLSNQARDASLIVPFGEIATVEEPTVSLESQESKTVDIQVEMPDVEFDGIVLGGISVVEKLPEGEQEAQVVNRFSYSLGVVLAQTEAELDSNIALTGVEVEQRNRRNVVVASIQNPVAKIMNDVSVEGKVYKANQTDVLYHTKRSDMRMAPNSTLDFGVTTNDEPLRAGKYRMELLVRSGEQEWTFEKEFEISAESARELNETAVDLVKDNTLMYIGIGVGIVALLLVVVIILLIWKKGDRKKKGKRISKGRKVSEEKRKRN